MKSQNANELAELIATILTGERKGTVIVIAPDYTEIEHSNHNDIAAAVAIGGNLPPIEVLGYLEVAKRFIAPAAGPRNFPGFDMNEVRGEE